MACAISRGKRFFGVAVSVAMCVASDKRASPLLMNRPSLTVAPDPGVIEIRGARQNNLKGFDLDLPLNRLIVVTGPSGSGKSSLAFDTIYA